MKRIGFLTSSAEGGVTSDDSLVLEPLRKLGISVEALVWDRDPLDRVDALVLRSCWDYHLKTEAFQRWLAAASQFRVFNPPDRIAWTLSKRYLIELSARGVPVPRTHWLPRGSKIPEISGPAVLKPAISLNGHGTFLIFDGGAATPLAALGDHVLQEFIPEIRTAGELSFVFLGGEFSHAVRKLPAEGEFRVQVEHGGRRVVVAPEARLVDQAREILRAGGCADLLYARVDVVETARGLVLMELEVIDPMLFLAYHPEAPVKFARAIAERV